MDGLECTDQFYPGLAYQETLANMGQNRGLFAKLADLFIEQHCEDLVLIEQALRGGDREAALDLIHALRGTAGNLGAITLYHCAGDLEADINRKKLSPTVGPKIKQAMTELQSSLTQLVADHAQYETIAPD